MAEEKKPEEKKPEVKKPEAPKKTLLDTVIDSYLGCKTDPVKSLTGSPYFDDLRKDTYLASIERAHKEPNPKDIYRQLGQIYEQMEQEFGYFVGKDKYKGRFDDMGREEQINMYTMLGTKLIDETINPSATNGPRRRR